MAQSDFGTIDPSSTSGVQLANILSLFQTAVETNHSGTSRPSYVKAGMLWLNTSTVTQNMLNFWTGTFDITLFIINTISGAITLPAWAGSSSQSSENYVPPTRFMNTTGSLQGGGTFASDHYISLLGDDNSPVGNCYYGTDANGNRGYHNIRTYPKGIRTINDYGPGTYSLTVPAGCYSAWFQIYGGGGGGYNNSYTSGGGDNGTSVTVPMAGGWGAACFGGVIVTPGETLNLVVGNSGQDTQLWRGNTGLVFASAGRSDGTNGSLSYAPSGNDMPGTAPLIRNWNGSIYSAPGVGAGSTGQSGYATVEYIQ